MLVTSDLGFGVVTRFMQALPRQFVNVGVAEQNMMGVAAGLALCGKIVFTYSIAGFPVLRCLEQIRNDVCYHQAEVKIAAVGGGLAYGPLGMSHHATEDLALMRALPNMTVLAPNDPREAAAATRAVAAWPGPCYLRLGRAPEPDVYKSEPLFQLGRAITVRDGKDVALLATGGMLANALAAAELLTQARIQVRVLSVHTIKPLDREAVLAAARETGAVVTVEEHNVLGGFGSAVAELLLESSARPARFRRLGLNDLYVSEIGDRAFLRARYGLDAEGIAAAVRAVLEG